MEMSYLSDGHCVYETVSQRSSCGGRSLCLESFKVESDLANVGADGLDGVGVGGGGGGRAGVARVPNVGVVSCHSLIGVTGDLKATHYQMSLPPSPPSLTMMT